MISSLLLVAAAVAQPVLVYERTNSDGTEPERVVVFIRAPDQVEVLKSKERCTNAAHVTGQLHPESGQAVELVGGRLGRDLAQQSFAWLSRSEAGAIEVRLGTADAPPVLSTPAGERWVLYDFDFADLVARPPGEIVAGEALGFELPLLLMGKSGPSLNNLGSLELTPDGIEEREGHQLIRYRATGSALDRKEGNFWFDAADARLVEARLPLPNHSEYRDFRLRLIERREGEAAWQAALADHWAGCPDD